MKINSLPTNYKKPQNLIIGTNTLNNVEALFTFNEYIPLLIGDGKTPRIWINIPANKEGTDWYPVVKDNFSTNKKVIVIKDNNLIKITTPDGVILDCSKDKDGSIQVHTLNMKPFGLDITSDNASMKIMGTSFSSSTFTNMRVIVGIGNKEPQVVNQKT